MATIAASNPYAAYMGGKMTAPVATAPAAGGSGWAKAGQFAASPTGAALINAAGGYMAAKGNEKQAELDRQLREQQLQQDARLSVARELMARNQIGMDRPIGESQNFANRQLLAGAVAKSLFSGGARVGAPAGIPSQFKGLQLDPAFAGAMTDPTQVKQATANSIAQRDAGFLAANPNAAQTDLAGLGLQATADPRAAAMARGQELWNQQNSLWENQLEAQNKKDLVAQTGKKINPKTGLPKGYEIDPNTGDLKKESFWKTKWGKAIKYGALGAATIATAGASSPAMAAAIAAGSGAFQGATSGGGWKGALTGAALGAATGGIGAGGGAGVGQAFGKAALATTAKTMLRDPRFYANVAPQALQIARS